MKNIWLTIILNTLGILTFGQSMLTGTVHFPDSTSVPFCEVMLYQNGTIMYGAATDFDGNYIIDSIVAGNYDIVFTSMEYGTDTLHGSEIPDDCIVLLKYIFAYVPCNIEPHRYRRINLHFLRRIFRRRY